MSIFKKYGGRMIVTTVTIILLITIGITANDRERISFLESKIGTIITPVQEIFYGAGQTVSNTFNSVMSIGTLKKDNKELKEKVAKLEDENREMLDIISKEEHLKNEMKLKKETSYNFVDTRIIAKEPGNWFNKFIVNKGSRDGVRKGSAVIQAIQDDGIVKEGLVGRVIEVGDDWSKVLSIVDEGSNVSYKVIRTQDFGVAKGNMNENIEGFLFDIDAEVVKGDKLITSGMGEVFIPGLYIGKITDVKMNEEELKKEIKVEPSVNFQKINDLFIILNKEG